MLEQLEAPGGTLGENSSAAMAERGRDRRLTARLDVHGAQGQRLALLGERTRSGRQPFALVERPLDRDSPSLGKSSLLEECIAALLGDGGTEPLEQVGGGLSPHLDALARAAETVESTGRALAPAGHGGELPFGALALAEQLLQTPIDLGPRGVELRTARSDLTHARRQVLEIECGQAGTQAAEFLAELLRALGGARLERERTEALLHLSLEIASALHLLRDARELQLGAVAAALEPSQSGGFLDEGAPLPG